MLSCEETQKTFSPYLDGQLTRTARAALDAHLAACPICRLRLDETRSVVRSLARLERPALPFNLAASISDAIMIERAARLSQPTPSLLLRVISWIEPRIMPYTVGALTSIMLFVAVSTALRPQFRVLRELAIAARQDTYTPANVIWLDGHDGYNVMQPVPLEGYAAPRLDPHGALAALVRTPSNSRRADDDDMSVVADVFSNGSASLTEIVQPPRNPHMLDEVQDALRRNPAFVPASLDQRPQTMRVVLSLSKVNVSERSF